MTTTATESTQKKLEKSDLNNLAEALKKVGGKRHSVIKVTFASLTSAATVDITTAASKAAATIAGIDTLRTGENLPAIKSILSLRVTAGTATAGHRNVTDKDGTASTSLALISDDGKSLTFEAAVTGFVIQYSPRAENDLTAAFAPTT